MPRSLPCRRFEGAFHGAGHSVPRVHGHRVQGDLMEIWFGSKEGQKNRLLSLDKFGSARRLPPAPLGGDLTPEFIMNIVEDNQLLRAQMTASLMA